MLNLAEKRLAFQRWGYVPSSRQLELHADMSPVLLIAGGERAGKSWWGGEDLAAQSMDGDLFWLVSPDYEQGHPEFRKALASLSKVDAIQPGSVSTPKNGSWEFRLRPGKTLVKTKTGNDPTTLASEAPDGIYMLEAAQQAYENYLKLFARSAEKRAQGNGFLRLIGTFEKGRGWYQELYEKFQGPNEFGGRSINLPTWDNLHAFPGGKADPAIVAMIAGLPADYVQERFGGVPIKPADLVFPEFSQPDHVRKIRFGDVVVPTMTVVEGTVGWVIPQDSRIQVWIDPGWAHRYAVLFVSIHGGLVFQMDEIWGTGKTGEQIILEAQQKRELWDRIDPTNPGWIDIAGKQHHQHLSQHEVWQKLTGLQLRSQPVPIPDGINRHRSFLRDAHTGFPRYYIDPRCKGSIWEYRHYKYPEIKENHSISELPIDRDNDAMKATAYGLVGNFGFVDSLSPRVPRKQKSEVGKMIDEIREQQKATTEPDGWTV